MIFVYGQTWQFRHLLNIIKTCKQKSVHLRFASCFLNLWLKIFEHNLFRWQFKPLTDKVADYHSLNLDTVNLWNCVELANEHELGVVDSPDSLETWANVVDVFFLHYFAVNKRVVLIVANAVDYCVSYYSLSCRNMDRRTWYFLDCAKMEGKSTSILELFEICWILDCWAASSDDNNFLGFAIPAVRISEQEVHHIDTWPTSTNDDYSLVFGPWQIADVFRVDLLAWERLLALNLRDMRMHFTACADYNIIKLLSFFWLAFLLIFDFKFIFNLRNAWHCGTKPEALKKLKLFSISSHVLQELISRHELRVSLIKLKVFELYHPPWDVCFQLIIHTSLCRIIYLEERIFFDVFWFAVASVWEPNTAQRWLVLEGCYLGKVFQVSASQKPWRTATDDSDCGSCSLLHVNYYYIRIL